MVGLTDLDGSQSHVQDVQAAYLNDLIDIGVSGTIIISFSVARILSFGIIKIGKMFFKIEFYHHIENLEATLVSMNEI